MTEYEIKYPNRLHINVREWWQYRELFYFLAWRDVKVKYKQTLLGISWAILQPLALMILFSILWKWAIHIDTGVPYPVFVYSGLILWVLFASGVNNASNSMIYQANLIKKVYFPRIIVPISAMLVSLLDFIITLFLYIALIIFYGINVSILTFIFFSAFCLLIVFISALGCGLFFAAINIRYRDVRHAIPFLLQLLFFATPVIFPLSVVKSKTLFLLISFNPIAVAIHLARVAISAEMIDWQFAITGLLSSFFILIVGLVVFNRNEINCADIL